MPEIVRGRTSRRALGRWAAAGGAGLAAVAGGCAVPGPDQGPDRQLRGVAATLRYLHWWPSVTRFGAFDAWRTAFREAWPNADVVMEEIPLGEFNTKFQVALSSGTAPDVVLQNSHAQTRWYDAGAHLDLGPLLARDRIDLRRDYALMGTELWCERTYALPVHADPNAVFYNKTLLRQAGLKDPWEASPRGDWTLDGLAAMARQASQDLRPRRRARPGGHLDGLRADVVRRPDRLDAGRRRGRLPADALHAGLARLAARPPAVLRLGGQGPQRAQGRRRHPPGRGAAGRDAFSAGKVAFRMRAVPDVATYRDVIKGEFEWDVLPFPGLDAQRPGVPLVAGDPNSVVKESPQPELAYQFAKLIATARGQEIVAERLSLPALKAKQDLYLKQYTPPAHVKVFQDVYTRPYGIHFRHHQTNDAWAIYARYMNQILAGDTPLAGGLQEANRLMNEQVKYGDCQPYKGSTHPIRPR